MLRPAAPQFTGGSDAGLFAHRSIDYIAMTPSLGDGMHLLGICSGIFPSWIVVDPLRWRTRPRSILRQFLC